MEEIKKWLEKEGLEDNALSLDKNHKVDLYLSDVLDTFYNHLKNKARVDITVILYSELTKIAKNNKDKSTVEIPEFQKIIAAIDVMEKYC